MEKKLWRHAEGVNSWHVCVRNYLEGRRGGITSWRNIVVVRVWRYGWGPRNGSDRVDLETLKIGRKVRGCASEVGRLAESDLIKNGTEFGRGQRE
jgi:hypothetical protein